MPCQSVDPGLVFRYLEHGFWKAVGCSNSSVFVAFAVPQSSVCLLGITSGIPTKEGWQWRVGTEEVNYSTWVAALGASWRLVF